MRLKDNFYKIKEVHNTNEGVDYVIQLNPEHFIYVAHFPNNPITPGVCIIQIVKELTEEILSETLFLKIVKTVKFTQIINPLQNSEITFSISVAPTETNGYKANVNVFNEKETFAKLSLQFTKLTAKAH